MKCEDSLQRLQSAFVCGCSETMGALQCAHWPAAWSRCVIPSCWKAPGPQGLWFHSAVWLCHQWCWDLISSCVGAVFSSAIKIDVKSVMDVLFSQHSPSSAQPTQWQTRKECHHAWFYSFSITLKHEYQIHACARPFTWVWAFAPAGGSTSLSLLVQALKTQMRRLQPVFPQTKRDWAEQLITLQPWNLYPRTDSQPPKDGWI